MHINSLKLVNYRNYNDLSVDFNEHINLILGKNGQGKTNIVESLTLIAIGKSFRTSKDKELIKFDKDSLYIGCSFTRNNIDKKIEIAIAKDKKGIKVNGVSVKSIQDLLGNLNVVIFSPEDLKLIKDSPKERRSFIDKEISQIMPRYYSILTSYNKVLDERNKLLKSHYIDRNLLAVYSETLANYAAEIYLIRRDFVGKLSIISSDLHQKLTSDKEVLKIRYKSQIEVTDQDDIRSMREKIISAHEENIDHDMLNRNTRIGPHRDDIVIYLNDIDVRLYGSQGQQRTASISLKLSEIELIKQEIGDYPVLILDDVFSELDQNRQKMLVEKLEDIQMFVTTADPLHKLILGKDDYSVFNIEAGKVVEIENGGK